MKKVITPLIFTCIIAITLYHTINGGFINSKCKDSIHVARLMIIQPHGERAHEYVKSYINCN